MCPKRDRSGTGDLAKLNPKKEPSITFVFGPLGVSEAQRVIYRVPWVPLAGPIWLQKAK